MDRIRFRCSFHWLWGARRADRQDHTTDHDSRIVHATGQPATQGYSAQAAVTEDRIIVAAEITVDSPDFGHLEPMVEAATGELRRAGIEGRPQNVVADPGYWHRRQMESVVEGGIQVVIPPDSGLRKGKDTRPGWDKGLCAFMRRVRATSTARRSTEGGWPRSSQCSASSKFNRGFTRFQRRGRSTVRSEWRLAAATTT